MRTQITSNNRMFNYLLLISSYIAHGFCLLLLPAVLTANVIPIIFLKSKNFCDS